MASGSYGAITPNPMGCVDINACEANPCGANGACTDAGAGVTDKGGYSCACNDGYEVSMMLYNMIVCYTIIHYDVYIYIYIYICTIYSTNNNNNEHVI